MQCLDRLCDCSFPSCRATGLLGATARRNKIHSVDYPVLNALRLAELASSATLLATEHPDVGVRSAGALIVSFRVVSSRAVFLVKV